MNSKNIEEFEMKKLTTIFLTTLFACSLETPNVPSGGTDGLECPGSLQCPCPCEEPMFCGPHGACTIYCQVDDDCGDLGGESCIMGDSMKGLCGVRCTPGGVNDCQATGIPKPVWCQTIDETNVCGF